MTAPRAYVIGYLKDVEVGLEIVEYIEQIEATMAPYGGRFLVPGGTSRPARGKLDSDDVAVNDPDQLAPQIGMFGDVDRQQCRIDGDLCSVTSGVRHHDHTTVIDLA